MKSSEGDGEAVSLKNSENTFLVQSPFFALLAVLMPVSVLSGFLSLSVLLVKWLMGPVFFPLGLWVGFGLGSAIIASIYWALVKKSKADHGSANIRGAILMIILAYFFGSLFRFNVPLGMKFFPSLFNIPSALAALVIWFPVLSIKRIFSGQELFESHIRLYDGERLRQIMLEDSSLMSEADGDVRKLMGYYGFLFIPSLILLIICGILGIPLSWPLIVLLVFLFAFGASVTGFLGFIRREYSYAAEGLVLPGRPRALAAAVIVVLGAAGLGILFSSNRSLLPPGLIADLLRRLAAFLNSLFRPAEGPPVPPPPPQSSQAGPQGLPPELLELMGETTPSPFWDYVKYGALALAAIFFLWFMIHPLLGRSRIFRGMRSLPKKAASFLRTWLKAMLRGLAIFFKSLRESGGKNLFSPTAEALHRLENNILEGYSPAKRRELRRSISLFARLIYWGSEAMKVPWKPSHAPAEYCGLLAAVADKAQAIIRAGELFEKALYSPRPLSRKEREEFKGLIEAVTV